ncbi:ExbD/TolR family protein [Aureliella helgolandensis]|uniref:Biopolymer transport protein ExbD n=1 Tax=Aureliella helgolandensis TaxID=2527968 RepID=A0A518GF98_9BACT|nr:biopolymer transporter ExbD [Aureliella helgolandensis]QDV27230.1 biopolymer transport protein ExbD [Aureliella helgolandensis]
MRIKRQNTPQAEADLTPMIDMTFQLIAFFMVLINFSQSEQNDRVVLPTSELAKPVAVPLEYPIIIHMTRDGTLVIGGDEIPLEALRSRMSPEIAVMQLDKKTARDANIIIRGHQTVPGGRVQDLINKCQELGFEQFALRVKEEI